MRSNKMLSYLIMVILIIGIVFGWRIIRANIFNEEKVEQTPETFNAKFEIYQGEQKGEDVQKLISIIKTNNANLVTDNYKMIKISENGFEISGTNLENKIKTENIYKITFNHDEEGYINRVNLEGRF